MTAEKAGAALPHSGGRNVVPVIEAALQNALGSAERGPWALLDFPAHSNVGDSAIWLGSLAFLEPRFGCRPSYVTQNKKFPKDMDRIMPQGPVLLHGGGNFGDLWQGFCENRIAVLRQFRHRRVVQMPQSIHFSDLQAEAFKQTRDAISQHPDFTLLVRDHPSLNFARKYFDCPVHLCPDMAFGLRELHSDAAPDVPVFALMRDDLERVDDGTGAKAMRDHARVQDWLSADPHPFADKYPARLARFMPPLNGLMMRAVEAAFRRQAQRHLTRGVHLLGQGEVVVTDRLHGHILCSLMGKRHVVLDNNYGKIFNYIDTWPDDGLTLRAASVQEAIAQLQTIN